MKHQFFTLIWFLFLSKEQQEKYKHEIGIFNSPLEKELLQPMLPIDLNDTQSIIDFLFIRSIYSVNSITHRRNKIFSFNPKTRADFIYLVYIENESCLTNLHFSQRVLLSRLVFKNKTKERTFNNIPIEQMVSPIVLEVNNV